jgi:prepilin-type N-terminal cleavage/methylation domain-containing protein
MTDPLIGTESPSYRPRRRGLTLVELLIAMVVLSLVGTGVASMLFAMANGVDYERKQRSSLVKLRILETRVSTAVRNASTVLAAGSDYIVLWAGDSRADGEPNISELRRIERDPGTQQVWGYAGRADLEPDQDTAYPLDSDFDAITSALIGNNAFPGERWADDTTTLDFSLDDPTPQDARLVTCSIGVEYDGHPESGTTSAWPRSD